MKQETTKEAAERMSTRIVEMIFKDDTKWQQQGYTEDEVLEIIRQYALEEHLITSSKPDIWFKQFKKK